MLELTKLPERKASYTADDVIDYVAMKYKVSYEMALDMIQIGSLIGAEHFVDHPIIISRSFGQVVALEHIGESRFKQVPCSFKSGMVVAARIADQPNSRSDRADVYGPKTPGSALYHEMLAYAKQKQSATLGVARA